MPLNLVKSTKKSSRKNKYRNSCKFNGSFFSLYNYTFLSKVCQLIKKIAKFTERFKNDNTNFK